MVKLFIDNWHTVNGLHIEMALVIIYKSINIYFLGPFYLHGLTLIPAWISNYIHYKVWDEIIHS